MILWTKYLDNSWPCTKQVKNDAEKQWKKFDADVWKIIFSLTFNSMESNHTERLLVCYKFMNKFKSLAYVYRFIARPPVLLQKKISIDNSVRRLLLLKIVLYSLFADAIDGLRPNSAYADPVLIDMRWWHLHKKIPFFHSGRDNFKSGSEYLGINRSCISRFLCCNMRILKKSKNRSAYGSYFRK